MSVNELADDEEEDGVRVGGVEEEEDRERLGGDEDFEEFWRRREEDCGDPGGLRRRNLWKDRLDCRGWAGDLAAPLTTP